MRRLCILLVLTMLLSGCAAGESAEAVRVVATDFPCYDLARQVMGTQENLTMLVPPGTDAHMYEPTVADIKAIYDADVFLCIGAESDAWALGLLEAVEGVRVVRLIQSVMALEEEGEEHDHEDISYDEHIWTSPVNMRAMLEAVTQALCAADPGGEAEYRANAAAYDADLAELDAAFAQLVAGGVRKEIVFADRFPFLYFAREYGLTNRSAFSGCSDEVQPTVQAVASLIDAVENDGVPVVYVIEMSTRDVARAVAEQTGAKIVEMHSCQSVTREEFDAGESYLSLMQRNLEALREGLY